MEPVKKSKSRDLSVYQFFQILQLEWIVADLRTRIYQNQQDKAYWNKVKEGKKIKVESIAEKNRLPTIFTDDEMKRILELKVYKEKGAPDFHYKNDAQKETQEPLDLLYYYYKDTDVRFEYLGETYIGTVKSYISYSPTIVVKYEGKELTLSVDEVSRIL